MMISISYFLIRNIFSPIIRILWIKKVTGRSNLPSRGSALIAFNHQSYLDFLCFVAISKRNVYFLTAEKFFTNKLWVPLMVLTGQIRVDRKSKNKEKTHQQVIRKLKEGKLIGIFPEGTRAPDKDVMLPAFSGVAKFALEAGVDIIPVGIMGAYETMSRFDKRPKLGKRIEFHIGEPVYIKDYKDREATEELYKEITEDVISRISKLSGKQYPFTQ